jgi:hypothetical protein
MKTPTRRFLVLRNIAIALIPLGFVLGISQAVNNPIFMTDDKKIEMADRMLAKEDALVEAEEFQRAKDFVAKTRGMGPYDPAYIKLNEEQMAESYQRYSDRVDAALDRVAFDRHKLSRAVAHIKLSNLKMTRQKP